MEEFHSNITFGKQHVVASTCNGLCRVSEQCPFCKAKWQRHADRLVAEVEDFLGNSNKHCCNCSSNECEQYRNPGDCGCLDAWR